ncbi:MAG: adenosylcobinamide-GDP ribazoletransferase [Coriobacteriales bacterium]|nr:adenosylcobinamide-GDP ribazoletransferase [Coriobacteriales bacterium]
MSVLQAIVMALSCFSKIPMPQVEWNERNMRYLMAAFPLVGAIVGGCGWLWWMACDALGFLSLTRAAGLALLPLAITGGIHMDGFADVVDAQSSHADPARKRQILKDPHVGAFAIMGICGYLIAYVALASELDVRLMLVFVCAPIISRCLSAWAAVSWNAAGTSGMFATVHDAANRRTVCLVLALTFAITAGIMLWCDLVVGGSALVLSVLLFVWLKRFAAREFGGMSGDLLGFYVQVTELAVLACVVVLGKAVLP